MGQGNGSDDLTQCFHPQDSLWVPFSPSLTSRYWRPCMDGVLNTFRVHFWSQKPWFYSPSLVSLNPSLNFRGHCVPHWAKSEAKVREIVELRELGSVDGSTSEDTLPPTQCSSSHRKFVVDELEELIWTVTFNSKYLLPYTEWLLKWQACLFHLILQSSCEVGNSHHHRGEKTKVQRSEITRPQLLAGECGAKIII